MPTFSLLPVLALIPCSTVPQLAPACAMFYRDPVNRGDMNQVELRIRREILESEMRLEAEIRKSRHAILAWQTALAVCVGIMIGLGFGWLTL